MDPIGDAVAHRDRLLRLKFVVVVGWSGLVAAKRLDPVKLRPRYRFALWSLVVWVRVRPCVRPCVRACARARVCR